MELENVQDVYSLTPIQEGILFHCISAPRSGVFIEQVCMRIEGPLDKTALRSAFEELVSRHSVLRTIFLWEGLDEPLQVVRETVDIPWQVEDWRAESNTSQEEKFANFLKHDRVNGFELSSGPLLRLKLIEVGMTRYRLVWTFHHLLVDGWSTAILLKEVFALLVEKTQSKNPEQQSTPDDSRFEYKQFVAHLQNKSLQPAENFWRSKLAGKTAATRLQDYRVGNSQADLGREITTHERQQTTVSTELTQRLRLFAKQNRLTLNSVVLGAWSVLLSTYSREDDIVFGTTVSGRPADLPGAESGIGLFINTLPMRVQVGRQSLVPWLQEIQKLQIEIRQFEHSPLAKVQRWSDLKPGDSLFENIVVFENYPESFDSSLESIGIIADDIDYVEQSNFPLALLVVPGDKMHFHLVHERKRFTAAFAKQVLRDLNQILEAFTNQPNGKVCEIELLSSDQQELVLRTWNDTDTEVVTDRTIDSLIEKHASVAGDKVAVVFDDAETETKQLTYRDLNDKADHLASTLIANGVSSEDFVGLFVERGLEMVVGILGILKSGAAYVPMDPKYPSDHLEYIAHDAKLAAIVTQPHLRNRSPSCQATVDLDLDAATPLESNVATLASNLNPSSNAYVIYTSGSQGRPKGVPVSHQNIVASTLARREFYSDPVDRFLLLSSFAFDSSLVGIFWTLVDGGTLVLPRQGLEQDLAKLSITIKTRQITHLLCLPSLYKLLLGHTPPENLRSLSTAIVAGEACQRDVVDLHLATLPQAKLYNEYGPTEATVWCVACELTASGTEFSDAIPIGKPISNTRIYLLDKHLRPVPVGVCGELFVAGKNLSQGYLNQHALTNERFVELELITGQTEPMYRSGDLAYRLPDGNLVFAGRADQQVKIRGYRIELGEIESALKSHLDVEEAVVVLQSKDVRKNNSGAQFSDEELLAGLNRLGVSETQRLLGQLLSLNESEIETCIREAEND